MRLRVPLTMSLIALSAVSAARMSSGQQVQTSATPSDSPDGMWMDISEVDLESVPSKNVAPESIVQPTVFRPMWLDEAVLDDVLASAPLEDTGDRDDAAKNGVTLWLPMPDGTNVEFGVVESPIMEPGLAEQFPEIKTYSGRSIDGSNLFIRFDRTPHGFHAIVLGGRQVYIDPIAKEGVYVSYFADEYPAKLIGIGCEVADAGDIEEAQSNAKALTRHGDTMRTYRLAVACSGEYAAFHNATSAETIGNAMAAITTTVNRVTGIYELELAIKFVLVANNSAILYWNSTTDPFTPSGTIEQLEAQSQSTINSVIGAPNYDIGHTFAVAFGLGGIGEFGGVCNNSKKAMGVSTGDSPMGDPYDIDLVAHEFGHQFNAKHTFNSKRSSCKGAREKLFAYERGAGTTLMSYAGICGSDIISASAAPAFHSESLRQIQDFVAATTCPVSVSTGNTGPIMNAGVDHTIPKETPFMLTAIGEDAEADLVTFTWEERDLGPAQRIQDKDNGKSPLLRCYFPQGSPSRTVPRLEFILAGNQNGNIYELLPSKARTMTFWAVGRDAHGGFWSDDTQVTVNAVSGPFKVKYPNTQVVIKGGKKTKVKWDVAKTNLAPVGAQSVKITLSTDGGQSFPTVLADSTPNDGEQKVKFPRTATFTGRVKIEGTNNIFFDISDADFAIDGGFNFVGAWHMTSQFGTPFVLHITLRDDNTSRLCADPNGQDTCSEGVWTVEEEDNTSGFISLFATHDYNYELVDPETVNLRNRNTNTLEYIMTRL